MGACFKIKTFRLKNICYFRKTMKALFPDSFSGNLCAYLEIFLLYACFLWKIFHLCTIIKGCTVIGDIRAARAGQGKGGGGRVFWSIFFPRFLISKFAILLRIVLNDYHTDCVLVPSDNQFQRKTAFRLCIISKIRASKWSICN